MARNLPPRPASRGFTLLEMLVAVMLFAIIMTGLTSSFYTLAQTEMRIDQRVEQAARLRTTMALLDQVLGRVSQRPRPGVTNVDESRFWFDGQPQSLRWVGTMPARHGAGGRYFFQLRLEPQGQMQNLVLRFAPWQDIPQFPDPAQMEGRVLFAGVTHLLLRYRGAKPEEQNWSNAWSHTQTMPSHVWLELATLEQGALPLKIVPMRDSTAAMNAVDPNIGGIGGL